MLSQQNTHKKYSWQSIEIERIRTPKNIKIGFGTAKNRPDGFLFFFHEKNQIGPGNDIDL